jgi:glutaredoxin 3
MSKIEIYSKSYCPYCKKTKSTLHKLGLSFTEYDITFNKTLEKEMKTRSGRKTVPQVFIDDQHIGGSDDFHLALQNGELSTLLSLS